MSKLKEFDLEAPPVPEREDPETLAEVDAAMREDEAVEGTPIEDVRKLLPKWITESSSRRER